MQPVSFNEQERTQVAELAQKIQEVTGGTVEIAFVDQGYTSPGSRETLGSQEGIRVAAATLGG